MNGVRSGETNVSVASSARDSKVSPVYDARPERLLDFSPLDPNMSHHSTKTLFRPGSPVHPPSEGPHPDPYYCARTQSVNHRGGTDGQSDCPSYVFLHRKTA